MSREQSPHSCSIEVFKKHRQEARQRYHKPLTEHIEALGRIVFGPTFAVDLDDDLAVARRTLCGVTLDVDHLSTGAFEQLGLLSRLACALIVSPGGGAPVVIDDALGWSDPPHLERMGPPTPPQAGIVRSSSSLAPRAATPRRQRKGDRLPRLTSRFLCPKESISEIGPSPGSRSRLLSVGRGFRGFFDGCQFVPQVPAHAVFREGAHDRAERTAEGAGE